MSVAKILEVTAASNISFEDAIQKGIDRVSDSITDVTGAWIQDKKVIVHGGKITEYRVNMKVTFVIKPKP